jgi:hypothetical protein
VRVQAGPRQAVALSSPLRRAARQGPEPRSCFVRAVDRAVLAGAGGILLLWLLAPQPATAEGYGADAGVPAPVHRNTWLSDGYWLDGAAETWQPAHRPQNSRMERYRPHTVEPNLGVPPPWPADPPGYGSIPFAGDTYRPDLRSTYTAYDRPILPGGGTAPLPGRVFRPLGRAPETGPPQAPLSGRSFDPNAGPRPGRDAYRFRPESEPQMPERMSPVWYRERASGKHFLFRPVTQDELVSRPSDHSFNSSRYAQPASADPGYPDPDRLPPPVHGGRYGQPGGAYSNAGGWGGDAYGGPVYGFE